LEIPYYLNHGDNTPLPPGDKGKLFAAYWRVIHKPANGRSFVRSSIRGRRRIAIRTISSYRQIGRLPVTFGGFEVRRSAETPLRCK